MEQIVSFYQSDEEGEQSETKVSKNKPPKTQISLAPNINEVDPFNSKSFYDQSVSTLKENPTYDVLYAPLKGPQLPTWPLLNRPASLAGQEIESCAIDSFTFDENFHTYKNFGYSVGGHFSGDSAKRKALGGSTVFRENLLRRKKYKKPEREQKGKAAEIDGYKGPWAKYKEDEDLIAEMGAKQKRMKELFERKKMGEMGKEGAEPNKDSAKEATENEKDACLAQSAQERAKESTVFEYVEERDYLGRTYMHCAHEFRRQPGKSRCFIPTKRVHTWAGHSGPVTAIRWFPGTGHVLLSASMDQSVKLWDVNSHRSCLRTVRGHSKGVRDISFSPGGARFLTVGHDQWIKVWDTETGKAVARLNSGASPLCARFYPLNDNELLAGQDDKLVVGWDLRQNEVVQKYDEHLKAVNAVVFIDQSRKFVSSADDKKIFIWEYGIPVVVNHISEPYMNSVPFLTESPDGEWFLGQSMDNSVVVYSSADKRHHRKRRYIGHSSYGHACQVDVSPDGQFIVSGDSDGKVFFWDWKTKKIFKRLNAHDKVAIGATWHPVHPSKVATCGWDGKIKYWD